jgi:hypothetical protein
LVRLSQPEDISMLSLTRARLSLVVPVLTLILAGRANAQSEAVTFDTVDGVKIKGTFWPGKNGRKAPTVLILHNFELNKGGDSHQDGWDSLGDALQKQGYAVLSFDFRGHGQSTAIRQDLFFRADFPQNRTIRGFSVAKPPVAISNKDFGHLYYPYLLNDIIAAKSYLDGRSDSGDCNSANLILIGAGEGATLGNIWLASEMHRFQAKPPAGGAVGVFGRWTLEMDPEGTDVVCAIWLTLSPTLAGHNYRGSPGLRSWITETGRAAKIPTVFIYGKNDKEGSEIALAGMEFAVPNFKPDQKEKERGYEFTGYKAVEGTKLTGSKLLDPNLETEKWIVEGYLGPFTQKQGVKPWRKHNSEESFYLWQLGGTLVPAKVQGDKTIRSFPTKAMALQSIGN